MSVSILLVLLAFSMILASCTGGGTTPVPTGDATPTGSPEATATPSPEPLQEITMWGEWSGDAEKQVLSMVDRFHAAQPSVKVSYIVTGDMVTKLLTATATGQTPDLILWDRWQTAMYASKNVFAPIDDLVTRDAVDMDQFFPEAIRELTADGKLYGLPLTVDGWNIFINRKLFREKGLEAPRTWDELEQCAVALTVWEGDKLVCAGITMAWFPWLFNQWIQTAGGSILTEDGTKTAYNSAAGKMVLEYWDRLLNVDKVYKIGFESGLGQGVDAFVTGKVAMTWGGLWSVEGYKTYGEDLEFELIPMPAGPNGDRGGFIGGFGLVIPAASKYKEQAFRFMKWWTADKETSLEWAKVSKSVPGNKSVTDDPFFTDDINFRNLVEAMQHAKIRPPYPGYSSLESQVIGANLQAFMEGKIGVDEVLAKMQTQGDKLLADYKQD